MEVRKLLLLVVALSILTWGATAIAVADSGSTDKTDNGDEYDSNCNEGHANPTGDYPIEPDNVDDCGLYNGEATR